MTTKLLDSLYRKAAALPPEEQDQFAAQCLAELEDQRQWDKAFAESAGAIDTLAERALAEHHRGQTVRKGFDEL